MQARFDIDRSSLTVRTKAFHVYNRPNILKTVCKLIYCVDYHKIFAVKKNDLALENNDIVYNMFYFLEKIKKWTASFVTDALSRACLSGY